MQHIHWQKFLSKLTFGFTALLKVPAKSLSLLVYNQSNQLILGITGGSCVYQKHFLHVNIHKLIYSKINSKYPFQLN